MYFLVIYLDRAVRGLVPIISSYKKDEFGLSGFSPKL